MAISTNLIAGPSSAEITLNAAPTATAIKAPDPRRDEIALELGASPLDAVLLTAQTPVQRAMAAYLASDGSVDSQRARNLVDDLVVYGVHSMGDLKPLVDAARFEHQANRMLGTVVVGALVYGLAAAVARHGPDSLALTTALAVGVALGVAAIAQGTARNDAPSSGLPAAVQQGMSMVRAMHMALSGEPASFSPALALLQAPLDQRLASLRNTSELLSAGPPSKLVAAVAQIAMRAGALLWQAASTSPDMARALVRALPQLLTQAAGPQPQAIEPPPQQPQQPEQQQPELLAMQLFGPQALEQDGAAMARSKLTPAQWVSLAKAVVAPQVDNPALQASLFASAMSHMVEHGLGSEHQRLEILQAVLDHGATLDASVFTAVTARLNTVLGQATPAFRTEFYNRAVEAFTEGTLSADRHDMIRSGTWSVDQLRAAARFLHQMPLGALREQCLDALVARIASQDETLDGPLLCDLVLPFLQGGDGVKERAEAEAVLGALSPAQWQALSTAAASRDTGGRPAAQQAQAALAAAVVRAMGDPSMPVRERKDLIKPWLDDRGRENPAVDAALAAALPALFATPNEGYVFLTSCGARAADALDAGRLSQARHDAIVDAKPNGAA